MSSEDSLTTRDDGRLCLGATLLSATYARGWPEPSGSQELASKLLSLLLNTTQAAGRISTLWCVCKGECELGYSPISDSPGSENTATPDWSLPATD